jgi:hypothetical protein
MSVGLGDMKRETVTDADLFLRRLELSGQPQANFYLKQMLTESGGIIQTPLPFAQTRFLNPSEIAALNAESDRHKAYRYLDMRSKNFPRLLAREDFPYDDKRLANEKKFGLPSRDEEMAEQPDNRMATEERDSPVIESPQDMSTGEAVSKEIPVIDTPDKASPANIIDEKDSASKLLQDFIRNLKPRSAD